MCCGGFTSSESPRPSFLGSILQQHTYVSTVIAKKQLVITVRGNRVREQLFLLSTSACLAAVSKRSLTILLSSLPMRLICERGRARVIMH